MEDAQAGIAALLKDRFGLVARQVRINDDQYSLNSLNGFFLAEDGEFFFKFHQEDGEDEMAGEYYRAQLLSHAGLPVDQPVHVSREPGAQILVYPRRRDPRFADTLAALDMADDTVEHRRALAAEQALNEKLLAVARATLHPIAPGDAAAEPIHQLFHNRLTPGGRYELFYPGQKVVLPGLTLPWEEFASLRFVVNGAAYREPLSSLFNRARARLAPSNLADAGGITAHGDAHNANVWDSAQGLTFYDPAFAGTNIPSLLAEVKSTFHNICAHPFWLYEPDQTARLHRATARREGDCLFIDTDWAPTAIRQDLMEIKLRSFWAPWLATLAARDMLPADWREVIRLALFLCPTLVMNLRAGAGRHNPVSSAIGFAVAVMAGSEAVDQPAEIDLTARLIAPLTAQLLHRSNF